MSNAQTYPWPATKTSAVIIAVLFDDGVDAVAIAPDLPTRSKSYSVWQYGARRGVERIRQTLRAHQTAATWFIPGSVALTHPDTIRALAADGHELASHGMRGERYDAIGSPARAALLAESRQILAALSGQAVSGFRMPQGRWPRLFERDIAAAGYRYSATLNGDDVPYSHANGLVEIPVHTELDDRPAFQFNFTPAFPPGHSRLPDYDGVLSNWLWEFDAYRQYGSCCVLQVHPEWLGTPGRISMLDAFLSAVRRHDDVWLTTAGAVADWHGSLERRVEDTHPIAIYEAYRSERGLA